MDVWSHKAGQNKERIRGTTKVGEISKKVQKRRLKWYRYVMRREEIYDVSPVLNDMVPFAHPRSCDVFPLRSGIIPRAPQLK